MPIEVALESILPEKGEECIVFESGEVQAKKMTEAVKTFKKSSPCRLKVTDDIDLELTKIFAMKKRKRNLKAHFSPQVWGRVDTQWREHGNVELIRFKIADSAWPSIVDAIAIPFGSIASIRF